MKKIRNEFPPPKELMPGISDRVDWAIRRAMSAEPSQRPASCREFVEDLTGQRAAPAGQPPPVPAAPAADVWYLVYRDETNAPHTVKGSTDGIRKAPARPAAGRPVGDRGEPHQGRAVRAAVEHAGVPRPGGDAEPAAGARARVPSPDETSDYGAPPPPAPGASAATRGRTPNSGRYPVTPPAPPPNPVRPPTPPAGGGAPAHARRRGGRRHLPVQLRPDAGLAADAEPEPRRPRRPRGEEEVRLDAGAAAGGSGAVRHHRLPDLLPLASLVARRRLDGPAACPARRRWPRARGGRIISA